MPPAGSCTVSVATDSKEGVKPAVLVGCARIVLRKRGTRSGWADASRVDRFPANSLRPRRTSAWARLRGSGHRCAVSSGRGRVGASSCGELRGDFARGDPLPETRARAGYWCWRLSRCSGGGTGGAFFGGDPRGCGGEFCGPVLAAPPAWPGTRGCLGCDGGARHVGVAANDRHFGRSRAIAGGICSRRSTGRRSRSRCFRKLSFTVWVDPVGAVESRRGGRRVARAVYAGGGATAPRLAGGTTRRARVDYRRGAARCRSGRT